ncbi:hypothetical protein V5O48_017894 [Marasmius crinis-equi]|uniref:Uncharacterized protein n=1 Tax=Marasmius crinis-equi TaxID=585013 RepID=A0ABR3EMN9_9AGAR
MPRYVKLGNIYTSFRATALNLRNRPWAFGRLLTAMSHASVSNIWESYTMLERDVVRALLTMRGDERQLRIDERKPSSDPFHKNRGVFGAEEYAQIANNVNAMVNRLHDARYELPDIPDA